MLVYLDKGHQIALNQDPMSCLWQSLFLKMLNDYSFITILCGRLLQKSADVGLFPNTALTRCIVASVQQSASLALQLQIFVTKLGFSQSPFCCWVQWEKQVKPLNGQETVLPPLVCVKLTVLKGRERRAGRTYLAC